MVIVNVSGGADPSNYVFEFCNGTVVRGQTAYTMENVGAYVHWMIVHDNLLGCVADTAYFGVFCLQANSATECFDCTGCSEVTIKMGVQEGHPDPHPFTAVVWRNGSVVDSITDLMSDNFMIPNLDPGTYTVRVYDRFRSFVETPVTIVQPSPIEVNIRTVEPRNNNCDDGRIELTALGGTGFGYVFEFNNGTIAEGPTYTMQNAEAGVHMLRVSDSWGCFIDRNIVLPCLNNRVMPNIFISPNNDGKNDFVKIHNIHHFPRNRVIFFNTYGEIVNEIKDYSNDIPERRWAGRNRRNQLLPDGVYYYIVEVEGMPPMGGWVYMVASRHN
jgi:gliding motility-associated-like protein